MPRLKDGTIQRSRFTMLKLGELSGVDKPAQPGALAAIMKRDDSPDWDGAQAIVTKYICETDGAHTFAEVLRENKFSQEIWPYTDALTQSIRSIVGDGTLSGLERDAKITGSVEEFLTAVRGIDADVAKRLEELISKREVETMKTVEQLEQEIATLKGQHTSAIEALQAEAQTAKDALAAEQTAHGETKKALAAATDEELMIGTEKVLKSEVGDQSFKIFKAQQAQNETMRLEKRATDEFPNVTGTPAQKAILLGAIEKISDEETRKGVEKILVSAQKMAKAGFERLGVTDPDAEPTHKAAVAKFDERVTEIEKRDDCTRSEAMSKARAEFPDEFAAYQGAAN